MALMSQAAVPACLVALVCVLGACGDGKRAYDDTPEEAVPDSGIVVYDPEGGGSNTAALTGRLEVGPGCVYVVTQEVGLPGKRFLPAFPASAVERNGDAVVYGGREYRDGDEILLGGGTGSQDLLADAGLRVPDDCEVDVPVWIVGQF